MKGIVFNQLQVFVELNHGIVAWDDAIVSCELPSQGVYVGTQSYDDSELMALVAHFSEVLSASAADITRAFGEFVFARLFEFAPEEAKNAKDLKSFLMMVDQIIHVEVSKLYHDANLPSFEYDSKPNSLLMEYRSPRKMCFFSEGLILAAAKHFEEEVELKQSQCLHDGADSCHIEVTFL